MANFQEAKQAVIDQVAKLAPNSNQEALRDLAEALAWLVDPSQPHGGHSS